MTKPLKWEKVTLFPFLVPALLTVFLSLPFTSLVHVNLWRFKPIRFSQFSLLIFMFSLSRFSLLYGKELPTDYAFFPSRPGPMFSKYVSDSAVWILSPNLLFLQHIIQSWLRPAPRSLGTMLTCNYAFYRGWCQTGEIGRLLPEQMAYGFLTLLSESAFENYSSEQFLIASLPTSSSLFSRSSVYFLRSFHLPSRSVHVTFCVSGLVFLHYYFSLHPISRGFFAAFNMYSVAERKNMQISRVTRAKTIQT